MRTSELLIGSLWYARSPHCFAFTCFVATRSFSCPSNILLATPKEKANFDDFSDQPSADKIISRRKRKKRCIDYPSSAYRRYTNRRSNRSSRRKVNGSRGKMGRVDLDSDEGADEVLPRKSMISDIASDLASLPYEIELAEILKSKEKTRLLESRTYARGDSFSQENVARPPDLEDLLPPEIKKKDRFWASTSYRLMIAGFSYVAFPYLTKFLYHFVDMSLDQLNEIASTFAPGISVLYGTFVSLTLSILYNRQQKIQELVSTESSLIALIQRNLLSLFRFDKDFAVEGSQCVADQIRTLVKGSRGQELMGLMYSDPYARILELLEEHELQLMQEKGDLGAHGAAVGYSRDILKDLVKTRAVRLSDEAVALPPTHFFILTLLTLLIMLGYTVSILPTVDKMGNPSNDSSMLFSIFVTVYVLFYNFATDLNSVFDGIYQIRRSSTASHLLQTKWLLAHHPLVKGEVDFDEVEETQDGDLQIQSPGLGCITIGKDEFYPS